MPIPDIDVQLPVIFEFGSHVMGKGRFEQMDNGGVRFNLELMPEDARELIRIMEDKIPLAFSFLSKYVAATELPKYKMEDQDG